MIRQWLGWKYALIVIGLLVLVLLVMDFNSRMAELRRLSDKKDEVAAQVTSLAQTQTQLETQIAYATSDLAVMEWAYQEGHQAREGDFPVVPLEEPGSGPEATAVPSAKPQVENNWQVWLSLFVDDSSSSGRQSP